MGFPERRTPPPGKTDDGAEKELGRLDSNSTTGGTRNTARPAIGEIVHVPGIGRCHVVGTDDPSLIRVQNARGVEFKVGERAAVRLEGGAK